MKTTVLRNLGTAVALGAALLSYGCADKSQAGRKVDDRGVPYAASIPFGKKLSHRGFVKASDNDIHTLEYKDGTAYFDADYVPQRVVTAGGNCGWFSCDPPKTEIMPDPNPNNMGPYNAYVKNYGETFKLAVPYRTEVQLERIKSSLEAGLPLFINDACSTAGPLLYGAPGVPFGEDIRDIVMRNDASGVPTIRVNNPDRCLNFRAEEPYNTTTRRLVSPGSIAPGRVTEPIFK